MKFEDDAVPEETKDGVCLVHGTIGFVDNSFG